MLEKKFAYRRMDHKREGNRNRVKRFRKRRKISQKYQYESGKYSSQYVYKFLLPGFQKPFRILMFGIRFLYNGFYGRWINWCGRIFWNRRSRPINIKFHYSKSSLRLKYKCQISIPNKELSISSKIARECLNNTSKV